MSTYVSPYTGMVRTNTYIPPQFNSFIPIQPPIQSPIQYPISQGINITEKSLIEIFKSIFKKPNIVFYILIFLLILILTICILLIIKYKNNYEEDTNKLIYQNNELKNLNDNFNIYNENINILTTQKNNYIEYLMIKIMNDNYFYISNKCLLNYNIENYKKLFKLYKNPTLNNTNEQKLFNNNYNITSFNILKDQYNNNNKCEINIYQRFKINISQINFKNNIFLIDCVIICTINNINYYATLIKSYNTNTYSLTFAPYDENKIQLLTLKHIKDSCCFNLCALINNKEYIANFKMSFYFMEYNNKDINVSDITFLEIDYNKNYCQDFIFLFDFNNISNINFISNFFKSHLF